MANAKRQRQDERRQLRLEAEAKVEVAAKRKKKTLRFGWIAGAVVVALFFVWLATRNDAKPADPTAGISISAAQRKKIETKPTITVPKVAPKTFEIKDLVEGSGAEAKDGDTLDVRYVGVSMLTGKEFDSSWKVSKDNTFQVTPLGTASVIRGWNEGLKGMKVGGRRQLILPPAFAYGDQGQGADIKANDTLVFVVDLMKLTRPPK